MSENPHKKISIDGISAKARTKVKSIRTTKELPESHRPKHSVLNKGGKDMNVYSSFVERRKAKKEAAAKRRAEDLATLPKDPVKRFFARLQPKRVARFVFSKRGLFCFLKICAAMILIGIIILGGLFVYYKKDLENIQLSNLSVSETVNTYLDRNGNVLWEDKGDGDYRLVVDGENIATYMRQATVAIEDKNFYNHPGIDVTALARATLSTLTGHGVQGGSTLTQQLIKQIYFSDEAKNRTVTGLPRKIKEMILAVELEKMYSKEQIITMYLNESPYGGRRNGVESAAQTYFGKSAKDLTLAESALLAAIPNNPAVLNPYNTAGNEALIARQQKTLDVMVEMGYITKDQADAAKSENILDTILPEKDQYDEIKAPHFVLEVKKQLEDKYGISTMRAGGFTITTSLDIRAQEYAEKAVADGATHLKALQSDNIAMASVDVETGQVIAEVGSVDWKKDIYGEVNAATSSLEPGSSIKPILDYAPLFMQRDGTNYGPGSILKDENIDSLYCAGYQGSCKLRNATGKFFGSITIRKALANSLNIPAVKALYINGIDKSLEVAHALGDKSYCSDSSGGLSIAIGSGCGVHLDEHANAYASMARGGVYKDLTYVLKVENSSHDVIEQWKDSEGTRVIDEQIAFEISSILSDANARSLVWGASGRAAGFVVPGVWTASKTGTTTTSNGSTAKDSLMASYSTAVATVAWNGNHDGAGTSGSNLIVRTVINDYMQDVHKQLYASEGKWKSGDQPSQPSGIQTLTVNGQKDIWPSWYNNNVSGVTKETVKFNSYNGKVASDCTPESLIKEVEVSYIEDAITKTKVYSNVPEGYDMDTTDDCSSTPIGPTLVVSSATVDSNGKVTVKFSTVKGTGSLSSYSVVANSNTEDTSPTTVQDGDNVVTFTDATVKSGSKVTVTIKDSYGLQDTGTVSVTSN